MICRRIGRQTYDRTGARLWVNGDPDGSKGLMRDTLIQQEFDPEAVERYQIKEEWVFDKQSSRLRCAYPGHRS